jgi:hypothetical protein
MYIYTRRRRRGWLLYVAMAVGVERERGGGEIAWCRSPRWQGEEGDEPPDILLVLGRRMREVMGAAARGTAAKSGPTRVPAPEPSVARPTATSFPPRLGALDSPPLACLSLAAPTCKRGGKQRAWGAGRGRAVAGRAVASWRTGGGHPVLGGARALGRGDTGFLEGIPFAHNLKS